MRMKIASLEIYNKMGYLMPTLEFMDRIVEKHSSLIVMRYQQFRLVVAEMISARIKNAYPGKEGPITVELAMENGCFEVSVSDKGVPGWHDFSYDKNNIAQSKEALSNYLLDSFADSAGMEKLGKNGQRVYARLKALNPINFKAPKPYEEETAKDSNITIKQVKTEEDVIEAIRCIYSEYGYSYSYEGLYYVDSFMRMINSGDIMSFIAVNDHGQTAGHFALVFSDLYKNMPELSTVVIRKAFRGLDLFSRFIAHCEKVCRENGVRALMGQPVLYHPMSQKALLRAGFRATSLLLSYIAPDLESEYNKEASRLSLSVCVKMLKEDVKTQVCDIKELRPFFDKIFGRLSVHAEYINEEKDTETEFSCESSETLRMSKIILKKSAGDVKSHLESAVKDAMRRKNEMIELAILLDSKSAGIGYRAAKEAGFKLSGIIPGGEAGDVLIMQMLIGADLEYNEGLVLVGEFEELRDDIVKFI